MTAFKVLLIDDDIDFSDLVRLRLQPLGCDVTTVHNWLSAMMKMGACEYDLMLIDVETPTGNGLTACRDLCENPKVAETPKYFVTGRTDAKTKRKCADLNAGYLNKSPDVFEKLIQVVQGLRDEQCCSSC